ncbi:MAG: MmcQ/YjbR family DNA-binding protein [Acidobacteria bacterium]|nr:MmcQ/YjbR family DNA-binding protein [Acidobacteriota bacterium]
MVKLTPEQQQALVRADPATFVPENGAWGRQGCTAVRLDSVDEGTLQEAMTLAWQGTAKKRGAGRSKTRRATGRKWVPRKR